MYHDLSDSRIVNARFPGIDWREGYGHINSMDWNSFQNDVINAGVSFCQRLIGFLSIHLKKAHFT